MTYQTEYWLEWAGDQKEVQDYIRKRQTEDPTFLFPVWPDGSPRSNAAWYDEERWPQMYELSTEFDDRLFTLEGRGEESLDIWREYWVDGRFQEAPAELVFPEFDPASLDRFDPTIDFGTSAKRRREC